MDWNDLRIALAVARTGSLTRAGAMLGLNHATVGRRLTALEAELGVLLFRRSRQGLTTTPAGEAMFLRATEIEARAERLRDDLARAGDGAAGVVRLLGNQWMLDRLVEVGLSRLLGAHPRLELRTVAARPRASLWRGEPGLGLWFDQPPIEGAFAIKLGEIPYAVYRARNGPPDPGAWVVQLDEEQPRAAATRAIERLRRAEEPIRLTAHDPATLAAASRAGAGKALLPVCVAAADPRLIRLRPGPPELVRTVSLHAHPDTLDTARVQALLGWIRAVFAEAFSSGR